MTPPLESSQLEAKEGMLVSIEAQDGYSMVISEYYLLGRFGSFTICNAPDDEGRIFQFTNGNVPDVAGFSSYTQELPKSCFVVDDDDSRQNPSQVLAGAAINVVDGAGFRGGNKVFPLKGPLYQSFKSPYYKVYTLDLDDIGIVETNPRPPVPTLGGGTFTVASVNVLNYFVDLKGRGADNRAEFVRQNEKMMEGMKDLDVDVLGVIELENTVDAVDRFVRELNAILPARQYVAASREGNASGGSDAIRTDVIFDSKKFRLGGAARLDDHVGAIAPLVSQSTVGALFNGPGSNRSPIAATLVEKSTQKMVTVVANHLKSKRPGGKGADDDKKNGAASWNHQRTLGAKAILKWLSTNPTGFDTPYMLLGDFNANFMEDPVRAVVEGGFESAITNSPQEYTLVFNAQFGVLDYIFYDDGLKLEDAKIWHVNVDEPGLFDYNLDYGRNPVLFNGTNPYRFSDHDPVMASFSIL
uniref:Endonuclease/exonuclease/phosphatase domain-containing protein n=2 Tax=Cyclophora tenuis TaxID=216820 RepID=A0A7S1D1T1_CYCTE|mmetsp:Transcript_19144/g.32785  ORF Transcript_19144/g.32785 Transcript_19144/m.32785 type:complete len:470 (+) Transcript_19144:147-1556(+)